MLAYLLLIYILGVVPCRFFLANKTASERKWMVAFVWPVPLAIWAFGEQQRKKARTGGPTSAPGTLETAETVTRGFSASAGRPTPPPPPAG